ncbi:MAG: cobalamin biosynthesis protein [Candidatus Bathyarchaeota archaeon]|nr:cobalamin biosynthesis protein [Candidatus Bathyarchaeota archaeon]
MFLFNLSFFIESVLIFVLAFFIDIVFGEIPDRAHPTVWMGKVIDFLKPRLKSPNPRVEKAKGVFLCVSVMALFGGASFLILWAFRQIPGWGWLIYIVVAALMLKTTFALKCMRYYTYPIEKALKSRDMASARKWMHFIVRRDPNELDERHITSAAVESIAESTTDGVTSPFFFFALFGVPGAYAFRVINTLDSMVGYKDPVNINIGWFSARMDTITNYVPTRITAVLMVAAAALAGADWRSSWRILKRDKNKTASPNAGYTISAMAGALNTQLEKEGHYTLGDAKRSAPTDITKAWRIMQLTTFLFGAAVVLPILALEALLLF